MTDQIRPRTRGKWEAHRRRGARRHRPRPIRGAALENAHGDPSQRPSAPL